MSARCITLSSERRNNLWYQFTSSHTMCSQLIKLSVAACVLLVILRASEALDCNQGKTTSMRYSQQQSRSKTLLFLHLLFVYAMASGRLGQAFCVFWKCMSQARQVEYSHISEHMCSRKNTLFKPLGTRNLSLLINLIMTTQITNIFITNEPHRNLELKYQIVT